MEQVKRLDIRPKIFLTAGLVAGSIDAAYATGRALLHAHSPLAPWQGVASGLMGKAAMDGGPLMALIGLLFHFFLSINFAFDFYILAMLAPIVTRVPVISGVIYGVVVLLIMNYFVVPFSQIGHPIYVGTGLIEATIAHILVMGLPIAILVSRGVAKEG